MNLKSLVEDPMHETSHENRLIQFPESSRLARLCRREKRFLVEVEAEGEKFWVHCNNSGSMLGLLRPGAAVLISPALRQDRRLRYNLELVQLGSTWVGVNTLTPNRMLHLSWQAEILPEVLGYDQFRKEVTIGQSRLDALLTGSRGVLWAETKNVTLVEDGVGYFPDAVTSRGQKHLRELIRLVQEGSRGACFYLVQRSDAQCFGPADFIDPVFADLFWEAVSEGVEMWPYTALVSPEGIGLGIRLPMAERR
jgi:sugar fermentation stimulation protein A